MIFLSELLVSRIPFTQRFEKSCCSILLKGIELTFSLENLSLGVHSLIDEKEAKCEEGKTVTKSRRTFLEFNVK